MKQILEIFSANQIFWPIIVASKLILKTNFKLTDEDRSLVKDVSYPFQDENWFAPSELVYHQKPHFQNSTDTKVNEYYYSNGKKSIVPLSSTKVNLLLYFKYGSHFKGKS